MNEPAPNIPYIDTSARDLQNIGNDSNQLANQDKSENEKVPRHDAMSDGEEDTAMIPPPLDDELILAVAYEMRQSQDKRVMANFANKIGQLDLFKKLKKQNKGMDEIMEELLFAWRDEVDATEENMIVFLEEYPEFENCVAVLRDALDKKKGKSLRKVASMCNLQQTTSKNNQKENHQHSTSTPLPRGDINNIVLLAKKIKNKDKNIHTFNSLATNLKVDEALTETPAMARMPPMNEIMKTVLLAWEEAETVKGEKPTAEFLRYAIWSRAIGVHTATYSPKLRTF